MSAPPSIDEATAAFLRGPVSISVASRAAGNVPVLVRCSGCGVSPDRRRVTLYLARSKSAALIEAVRATRAAAAVFSLPSSHRSLQLKGTDAAIAAPAPGDFELCARYVEAFAAEIDPLGHSVEMVRALLRIDPEDLATLAFTPAAAFTQTPGPGAGAPLRPAAP